MVDLLFDLHDITTLVAQGFRQLSELDEILYSFPHGPINRETVRVDVDFIQWHFDLYVYLFLYGSVHICVFVCVFVCLFHSN